MKIMFMGTPDFAQVNLQRLVECGHEVCCAVSQPDKPHGRKMELLMPPVKEYALSKDIPVYQPETLKDGAFTEVLEKYQPEVIVVVAYGKLLPKYVLNFPKYGCINVHGSLLPKYRGSAPVQWSVINGDKQAGVTTMYMNEGMDTGDILLQKAFDIKYHETSGMLMERMADIGAELLVETLEKLEKGQVKPVPQKEEEATKAPMLTKELGKINWNDSADKIENLVYGLQPWPTAFFETEKGMVKVFETRIIKENSGFEPGCVTAADNTLVIQTGNGQLEITQLQLQGKKRMAAADFLRGNKFERGQTL